MLAAGSHKASGRALQSAMWAGMILLCAIGAAAVIRRTIALALPPGNAPPQLAALDAAFRQKAFFTLLHIVPALVLIVLVPFQFSLSFRSRHIRTHRWIGRIIVGLGVVVGISALFLLRNPIGGSLEVSAILIFDAIFLVSLIKAFLHVRAGKIAQHREWMIRAMSVALGVATVRPIMGIFFATSRFSGLTPHEFFGMAFSLGFAATYVAGETWIRYTRVQLPQSRKAAI